MSQPIDVQAFVAFEADGYNRVGCDGARRAPVIGSNRSRRLTVRG
jgi:hypothetical protein